MRAWGVIALVVTTTLALLAGMLTLGPLGVPDSSFGARDPSGSSPRRGTQAPMIIAPPTIDLEPSSHAPLLIEIGPPEWVPHGSTLQVQGLPASVTLSHGRRVSSKLWAVPIAALSKVRIDVAANATAGQSDVTLTLVGSDGGHIAEAHTAISIDALTIADAKEAAHDASGVVSRPQGAAAPSPPATAEVSPGDRATSERQASGTSAASIEADRATQGAPSDQRASGQVVVAGSKRKPVAASRDPAKAPVANANGEPATPAKGAAQSAHPLEGEEIAAQREGSGASGVAEKEAIAAAKGPAVVVQREAAVVPPEPTKPALTAASEGAGLAAAKGGPKKAAKGDAQSVQPILGEEIASQRTIKGAAVAPADKDVASAPKGAQREVVVAEPAKPSIAVSEASGLAAAKGGSAMPAKATAQAARSVDREENPAQREDRSAPAAPADKESAPSSKGPAAVAQREPVAPPERAKPSTTAGETTGLVEPKGGPTPPASDAQRTQPMEREAAGQGEGRRAAAVADSEALPSPKGPAGVAAASPEPAKTSSSAASEAAGHDAPKDSAAKSAKSDFPSAHPVAREEIAARREVISTSPAPAGKRAASSPEAPAAAMQHAPVVASELAKPSVVANAAAGLDEPNGGPTTSVKGSLPSAHPVAREEIAARREVINASPAPAGKQTAPSPQGSAAAAPREPVVASEPMKPSVTASSEVAGLVKPNVGPATSARSDAPTRPAERDVVVSQRGPAAPTDKEPASSRKGPIAVAGEPVAASPEPAKPKIAAGEAAGLAGAKDGPAAPAKSEAQSTRPMERGEVAGQSEARPNSSATATSEAAGSAGVKAESTKPANNDAQRLHPILGEEIAAQREIKSAFAAPVDADATRGRASRGDLQEGERYVARGEESLAAGNVAVAREFFLRAADAGAARGALLLASTYDPYELVGLHVVGVQPNIDLARRWYKRAEALGEKRASERITRLERR